MSIRPVSSLHSSPSSLQEDVMDLKAPTIPETQNADRVAQRVLDAVSGMAEEPLKKSARIEAEKSSSASGKWMSDATDSSSASGKWMSDATDLMKVLPQHRDAKYPFNDYEIKVQVGEGEFKTFIVPGIVLINLSPHFQKVFASAMAEKMAQSMIWAGPGSANPYLHFQAVVHELQRKWGKRGFDHVD